MTITNDKPWAGQRPKDFSAWHSMCSYLGAFPPALANYFIRAFTDEDNIVLDPFSGRGTTLLEARILGRQAVASDLNPIALALSAAKSTSVTLPEVLARIEQLQKRYDTNLYLPEAGAQSDDINLIYHPRTLAQLCYLKRRIVSSTTDVDSFLVGCVLGIMHGGVRKDGSSGYASISMPNTFSMSPEYVRRFVQTNQLDRKFHDVFELLKAKAERLFRDVFPTGSQGLVVAEDVKKLSDNEALQPFKGIVDLVLTSPPYLGVVNYAKQNWIRTWFLNEDPADVSSRLDDDLNLSEWLAFMEKSLLSLIPLLRPNGTAVFIIGDVAKTNSIVALAREFCHMVQEKGFFKNIWYISDTVGEVDKTTRIWGETKGKATAIDRIVVLSNGNPFANNDRLSEKERISQLYLSESQNWSIAV